MGRYQMIQPYSSGKVYEGSSLKKCAKRFYNQIKGDPNNKFFVLKDIDTAQMYTFAVGRGQSGGMAAVVSNIPPVAVVPFTPPVEKGYTAPTQNMNEPCPQCKPELANLASRVEKLESQMRTIGGQEKAVPNAPPEDSDDEPVLPPLAIPNKGLINPPKKEQKNSSCSIQ